MPTRIILDYQFMSRLLGAGSIVALPAHNLKESGFSVCPLLNFDYCALGALWWSKTAQPGLHFGQCKERREYMVTHPDG